MMRCVIFVLICLCTLKLSGQFLGGVSDGFTHAALALQNQLPNIYTGGSGDGNVHISAMVQNSMPNIYSGGLNDGFAQIAISAQNAFPQIYSCGFSDGNAQIMAVTQNNLPGIYSGGPADGFVSHTSLNENILLNIYTGGGNDGSFASLLVLDQNPLFSLATNLISFSATWQQQDAILSWQVKSTDNIVSFEIERSLDNGNRFQSTGHVKPQLNNAKSKALADDYSFYDLNAYSLVKEKILYRLKASDRSGNYSYSLPISLKKLSALPLLLVYPNPSNGSFILQVKNTLTFIDYRYQLLTSGGALLKEGSITEPVTRFNLANLPSSMYILSIKKGKDLIENFTIVITR